MENDYIVGFDHPKLGKIKITGYPVHFSGTCARTRNAAPELGEHTESVCCFTADTKEASQRITPGLPLLTLG